MVIVGVRRGVMRVEVGRKRIGEGNYTRHGTIQLTKDMTLDMKVWMLRIRLEDLRKASIVAL